MAARRIDARKVPRDEYLGRWRKADQRIQAMDRELLAGALDPALVLAVQAAIAACDAFTIRFLELCSSSQRHFDALELFDRVTPVPGTREARVHLVRLLEEKANIEYSGRPVRGDESERLAKHARRFVEFVEWSLRREHH